jgi:hypothetical protein
LYPSIPLSIDRNALDTAVAALENKISWRLEIGQWKKKLLSLPWEKWHQKTTHSYIWRWGTGRQNIFTFKVGALKDEIFIVKFRDWVMENEIFWIKR